jgi:hypothetical protein
VETDDRSDDDCDNDYNNNFDIFDDDDSRWHLYINQHTLLLYEYNTK